MDLNPIFSTSFAVSLEHCPECKETPHIWQTTTPRRQPQDRKARFTAIPTISENTPILENTRQTYTKY